MNRSLSPTSLQPNKNAAKIMRRLQILVYFRKPAVSALAGLETRVDLVDHIKAAAAAHDTVGAVAFGKGLQ
jgi:hypothetical protein